jgi:aspartate racemase
MHIGMIVGIGPAATDYYYRYLIGELARCGKDLELSMAHADTATLLRNQAQGDIGAQVAIYSRLADRMRLAGAEALAVTSIAGHFCIGEFKTVSPLPVIDLLVEVDRVVAERGYRRLGLIGTRAVMESGFYGAIRGAEIVAPPGNLLDEVHDAYVAMATSGVVTEAQRSVFFRAGEALVEAQTVEAVMLAGTDLGLAFAGQDPGFATLDCAQIHAAAIASAAMQ